MSLIVDALRRGMRTPCQPRRGFSSERIIGIAAAAIALGFLAVALPACWIARQTASPQAGTAPPPDLPASTWPPNVPFP